MSVESLQSDRKNELLIRLKSLIRSIEISLRQASDFLESGAIDSHLSAACLSDPYSFAANIPVKQQVNLKTIRRVYSGEFVQNWNRLTLTRVVQNRLEAEEFSILPAGVQEWSLTWFEQILNRASDTDEYFDFVRSDGSTNLPLSFDFAVAAGRMLPVGGAWVVENRRILRDALFGSTIRSGHSWPVAGNRAARIVRRELAGPGWARTLYDVFRKPLIRLRETSGKYGSYLVIHTADHYRRWFSARYQQSAFENIAELVEANSSLEGLYRSSWLLDPQVFEMEPRLRFLIATPVDNGALYNWRANIDVADRKEILDFSAQRRERYEAGTYRPEEWAYFWPREAISAWGSRNKPAMEELSPTSR
jgi:hypothetical protein